MTIREAIEQLLEVESKRTEEVYGEDTFCVGLARVGGSDQVVASGSMRRLSEYEFGGPLHSLVIPGEMHFLEEQFVRSFSVED